MGNQPTKERTTVVVGYSRPPSTTRSRNESAAELSAAAVAAAAAAGAGGSTVARNSTAADERTPDDLLLDLASLQSALADQDRFESEMLQRGFDKVTAPAAPRPFHLHLASRRLVYLTPNITFAVHLHTLELQRNSLSTLPDELSQLQCLTWLDISHNAFKTLPTCIDKMMSLLELKADFNEITTLSPEFCKLDKLMTLSLSHNRIAQVPPHIEGLDSLVSLVLSFNPLRLLPSQVGRLKYLRYVVLENCPLHSRPSWTAEQHALAAAAAQGPTATSASATPLSSEPVTPIVAPASPVSPTSPTTPATPASAASATSAASAASSTKSPVPLPRRPVLSLRELAARVIVRLNIPVVGPVPSGVTEYLSTAKACSACGGPYFSAPVLRLRFIEKNGDVIPLEHSLCSEHWRSEGDRIRSMFLPKPATAPRPLTRMESENVVLRTSAELIASKVTLRKVQSADGALDELRNRHMQHSASSTHVMVTSSSMSNLVSSTAASATGAASIGHTPSNSTAGISTNGTAAVAPVVGPAVSASTLNAPTTSSAPGVVTPKNTDVAGIALVPLSTGAATTARRSSFISQRKGSVSCGPSNDSMTSGSSGSGVNLASVGEDTEAAASD